MPVLIKKQSSDLRLTDTLGGGKMDWMQEHIF